MPWLLSLQSPREPLALCPSCKPPLQMQVNAVLETPVCSARAPCPIKTAATRPLLKTPMEYVSSSVAATEKLYSLSAVQKVTWNKVDGSAMGHGLLRNSRDWLAVVLD